MDSSFSPTSSADEVMTSTGLATTLTSAGDDGRGDSVVSTADTSDSLANAQLLRLFRMLKLPQMEVMRLLMLLRARLRLVMRAMNQMFNLKRITKRRPQRVMLKALLMMILIQHRLIPISRALQPWL